MNIFIYTLFIYTLSLQLQSQTGAVGVVASTPFPSGDGVDAATPTLSPNSISQRPLRKKVCQGKHIRNDLTSFDQLKDCNIIDGPLTIALVANNTNPYTPQDYQNITFPALEEITEYLLIFRVQGLTTLADLFPNLAVIRGRELVSNYALIIYEMTHLQKINLPKLTDILRGSVRIEGNPNLCFASTINWDGICKHAYTHHFIKDNNSGCNNRCPDQCHPWPKPSKTVPESTKLPGDVTKLGADNNQSVFCWNSTYCQETCFDNITEQMIPLAPNGECCSPLCAGGCTMASRSDKCVSCRFVAQGSDCVHKCDSDLYEYKGKCVTEEECSIIMEPNKPNPCGPLSSDDMDRNNFKAVRLLGESHGRCQATCPPGYEENPLNKNKCRQCDKGKCRKICKPTNDKPFMVTNINSLRELDGCNAINGSLEISIKGGKNVLHELESAFQDLEEISGYLKITRSHPILTLDFLRGLKVINGSQLDRAQYSLVIIDNPNLQDLFKLNANDTNTSQKRLNILNGKIFVHLNPKLCPHRIDNLKLYASVAPWDDKDVSVHTNGDKEACNTKPLQVEFVYGTSRICQIRFENFASKMDDPRSLLYYLINYREVPSGTVTMFDGRDGCNSQNDVWMTVEEPPLLSALAPKVNESGVLTSSEPYQDAYIVVKPATRYALYIKTFTILSGSAGALSEMIYFETAPDTPGIPRDIKSFPESHDSVRVNWSPPSKPNGNIESYTIFAKELPIVEDFGDLDVCDQIGSWDRLTSISNPSSESKQPTVTYETNTTSSAEGPTSSITVCKVPDTDPDTAVEKVTFQDAVIDLVYLRQPCPSPKPPTASTRRKKSIEKSDESVVESKETGLATQTSLIAHLSGSNGTTNTLLLNETTGTARVVMKVDTTPINGQFEYKIAGLKHYSMYHIEVVACHGEFHSTKSKLPKGYKNCSIEAITQVRTHALQDNDKIRGESLVFYQANETISDNIVIWKKPEQPNGPIIAYRVRYRLKDGPIAAWTELCVNNTVYERLGGVSLIGLSPGTYVFSVQAVTMYTENRYWSEPELEFEIPQNYLVSPFILYPMILVLIALIGLGAASATYYYQKKQQDLLYASVNPDYINYEPDEWEIDSSKLIVGSQIGTGSFGVVYRGQLTTEKGTVACAVKTVPKTSTAKQRMDFLREGSMMKKFDTFHVVKLYGVVSVTTPVYVIMELMEHGDLKDYLRGLRDKHEKEKKTVVDGIYLMAAQIADGMAYLTHMKFVHRDLAARNCMVGANQVCKIADFGLTRDVYANDYYRRDTAGVLPVRWMAPEALTDNIYTHASDVWSYGIVLWEIVTFSAYPYQGLSNEEVIKKVTSGYTMPRPTNCPNKLYEIMHKCWRRNDRDRPTFNDIVEFLLPETEDQLFPNCFYRKPQKSNTNNNNNISHINDTSITEGDILARSIPEENGNIRTESVPLLSWPNNRANGISNDVNHHVHQEATD